MELLVIEFDCNLDSQVPIMVIIIHKTSLNAFLYSLTQTRTSIATTLTCYFTKRPTEKKSNFQHPIHSHVFT